MIKYFNIHVGSRRSNGKPKQTSLVSPSQIQPAEESQEGSHKVKVSWEFEEALKADQSISGTYEVKLVSEVCHFAAVNV